MIPTYIVSDQHFEFRRGQEEDLYFEQVPAAGAKIAIVAGDLDLGWYQGSFTENMKRLCSMFEKVYYVPGNHDYYECQDIRVVDAIIDDLPNQAPNLTILKTGHVYDFGDGRRILGDAMWVKDTQALRDSKRYINDNFRIPLFWQFMPEKNRKFVAWLNEELREGDIVVTHHLPSDQSTPLKWRGSPTQPWFVCDMEGLILERKPAYWIHGHTHTRCDYMIGQTRVICNPVGYPKESGPLPGALEPYIFEL